MRSPSAVILCVIVAGAIDGAWRAHFQQRTILGERTDVREINQRSERLQVLFGTAMVRANGQTLMQPILGIECTDSWGCENGLVCRGNMCTACADNDECSEQNPEYQCLNTSAGAECRHKALWAPIDDSDIAMSIITVLTIMLSAPAGVGGGCILVPMFLTIGRFSSHYSSALSTATIFGGAVSNNYFNLQKRHPKRDRPLIDFNACMILVPVLLLGTILGVFLNETAPKWLISVLLVVALVYTTWRTTLKAIETYEKESVSDPQTEKSRLLPPSAAAAHPHPAPAGTASDPSRPAAGSPGGAPPPPAEAHVGIKPMADAPPAAHEPAGGGQELQAILRAESVIDPTALGALALSWVFVAVFSALKGGGEGAPGVAPCGSAWYWALVLTPVPLVGALVWHLGGRLAAAHEAKLAGGYDFADGDLRWTRAHAVAYPLYCMSAGVAAGALGIAAGMVLGPLLLELGMLPIVATASSGFMVLFVSSSTAFQYLVMGQLQGDYAACFCALGAAAGAVGNGAVGILVRRYRKTWFVVALLAAVFAVSAVFMAYASYESAAAAQAHGRGAYGHPLCPPPPRVLAGRVG